jgi:Kae1-associated kinase Bud32
MEGQIAAEKSGTRRSEASPVQAESEIPPSSAGKIQIAQGAEAVLWRDGETLIKERVRKGYRLLQLDTQLRRHRTAREAKLLGAARRAGVCTPHVLDTSESALKMEWLEGRRIKELLDSDSCMRIGRKIGIAIGRLHTYDIIHGDLTTSNMIVRDDEVCFIDFGLGFQSSKIEDKAVDLYLLYHAIEAAHWDFLEMAWLAILNGYRESFAEAERVIKMLSAIEKRGRYRER